MDNLFLFRGYCKMTVCYFMDNKFQVKKISEQKSSARFWLFLIFIFVAIISYFYLAFFRDKLVTGAMLENTSATTPVYYFFNRLDGQGLNSATEDVTSTLAVMIDNQVAARPQSGLTSAKIIYEVPAEGNITRFMAIFDSRETVDKVGPVRSARPYFLDFASEYGKALYVHVGGSPAALAELDTTQNLYDVNEFYFGSYFWRASDRNAPHNVYTSSANWQKLISKKNYYNLASWDGLNFATNTSATVSSTGDNVSQAKVAYSKDYEVSWQFSSFTNLFEYYQNSQKFIDPDNQNPLAAGNVILQYVEDNILDDYGRLEIKTIGSGDARVLKDGKIILGSWKKTSATGRTRFYDKFGNEIKLNPGVTFIQIIPSSAKITIVN